MRLCLVCGKPGRGRGHPAAPGAPSFVNERAHERSQDVIDQIAPKPVGPVERLNGGTLRYQPPAEAAPTLPPQPDWRLFAAYHAIVMAEEVKDLDSGLTLALRVAARELNYVLRPVRVADGKPNLPSVGRPDRSVVVRPDPLPYIRDERIRRLAEAAVALDFSWRKTGTGHLRLQGPDGRGFTISTTAVGGEARSYKNARAAARRAGVIVD